MRRFVVRNWEPARATGGRAPGVRSILIDRRGTDARSHLERTFSQVRATPPDESGRLGTAWDGRSVTQSVTRPANCSPTMSPTIRAALGEASSAP